MNLGIALEAVHQFDQFPVEIEVLLEKRAIRTYSETYVIHGKILTVRQVAKSLPTPMEFGIIFNVAYEAFG